MLKIDVFNHILPPKYMEALLKESSAKSVDEQVGLNKRQALHDLEARFRIMDRYEGYIQILDIAIPPVEDVASPEVAADLAKIANDEMAELVMKYPDRFIAAVACLPMNNMDAVLKEVDRAITELKFRGVQITSNIMDKSLDSPEFEPLFEKMNYYNLPILMHPRNMQSGPRTFSWNTIDGMAQSHFNWPYETTIAMGCIVLSGMLNKYPNLKIITHHCGGFVPYQANRIARMQESLTYSQTASMGFNKNLVEYYKMFYGDTACWGNTPALMCGYAFFGADHILFGTDMPFGTRGGDAFVRDTILSVEEMAIPEEDKKKIFEANARKLFRIPI
jgi:predicted TIM-barrel fold metal-dependent hydrolase